MREKILHKSAELFLTLGFKSVTMDDIANEMGISKKTIYVLFLTDILSDSILIWMVISLVINVQSKYNKCRY